MKCADFESQWALFAYGELSFDEEERVEEHLRACVACRAELQHLRRLHSALDSAALDPDPALLVSSRSRLSRSIHDHNTQRNTGFWAKLREGFTVHIRPFPSFAQPLSALALIVLGYAGARVFPLDRLALPSSRVDAASLTPVASHVRDVEPGPDGRVQIVVEETRQRVLTGAVRDPGIQSLLISAARESADPGLRVESVDALGARSGSTEIRDVLLNALAHDSNAGVRLKALDGLKRSSTDPVVRRTLAQVLLKDDNPGVRTQAIDLLVRDQDPAAGVNGDQMAGLLQELLRKEDNNYVRMRSERALQQMKASAGIF